jgi:hypothetical protein
MYYAGASNVVAMLAFRICRGKRKEIDKMTKGDGERNLKYDGRVNPAYQSSL